MERRRLTRPIDILEASYDLRGADDEWLDALLRAARPDLDTGLGIYAFSATLEPTLRMTGRVVSRGVAPGLLKIVAALNKITPPKVVARIRGQAVSVGSMVAEMGGPSNLVALSVRTFLNPVVDCLSAFAQDGEGRVLQIVAPSPALVDLHPRTVAAWRRVLIHLGTAFRLRRRLAAPPEALVTPDGRVDHAEAAAKPRDALASLGEAVRRAERARGPLRRKDPDHALELWSGLVDGRWSLVDHWESDGRRYLAAHENVPALRDPRALGPTERAYLALFLRGATTAEIAFALGRSEATVSHVLSAVAARLRLPSRVALASLGEAECLERLRVSVGDDSLDLLVLEPPTAHQAWREVLSESELAVALLVCAGLGSKAIADQRGVSARTVENQIAAIYTKTGATRATLAAVLRGPPSGAPERPGRPQ